MRLIHGISKYKYCKTDFIRSGKETLNIRQLVQGFLK